MTKTIRTLLASCHFTAFALSLAVWWVFSTTMYEDSALMVVISAYVVISNLSRREIVPALLIILLAFAVNWFFSLHLYQRDIKSQVMLNSFWFVFYLSLSWLLFRYHCSPTLQRLFGVQFCRQYIPQVIGICIVLSFNSISTLCVLAELVAYWIQPEWFSQTTAPFFYRMYPYTSALFTCLMLLGIWSMMLDAHYLKARLDHKKNSAEF